MILSPPLDCYENRLREWMKRPRMFSIDETIELLGLDPENHGTYYAIPSIRNVLINLVCTIDGDEKNTIKAIALHFAARDTCAS